LTAICGAPAIRKRLTVPKSTWIRHHIGYPGFCGEAHATTAFAGGPVPISTLIPSSSQHPIKAGGSEYAIQPKVKLEWRAAASDMT
jgi:hypothetical protein